MLVVVPATIFVGGQRTHFLVYVMQKGSVGATMLGFGSFLSGSDLIEALPQWAIANHDAGGAATSQKAVAAQLPLSWD
jgi:hypothetical protein